MLRACVLFAVLLLSACTPSKLAYGEVKSALVEAGLSQANSECMADRMTDKLSLRQLMKLRSLKGRKRSIPDYVAAVRKVGDAQVVTVTATSAALCSAGLAR
jgi:hypothetical protein